MNEIEEAKFVAMMRDLPDFECFPIPAAWFSKYAIPPRSATAPAEFIQSGYTMKCTYQEKDLDPLILDKPQRDGYIPPILETEPVKVEIVSRPFELKENEMFPAVLPSLRDLPVVPEQSANLS